MVMQESLRKKAEELKSEISELEHLLEFYQGQLRQIQEAMSSGDLNDKIKAEPGSEDERMVMMIMPYTTHMECLTIIAKQKNNIVDLVYASRIIKMAGKSNNKTRGLTNQNRSLVRKTPDWNLIDQMTAMYMPPTPEGKKYDMFSRNDSDSGKTE